MLAGRLFAVSVSGYNSAEIGFFASRGAPVEAPLTHADAPWLAGAIAAGGVAGPLRFMCALATRQPHLC